MDRLTEIRLWHEDVKMRYDDKPSRAHQDREVMLSEIDKLQAEVERLTRERDDARAEVERLKLEPETLRAELIAICNASRAALANAYDRARGSREALEAKP